MAVWRALAFARVEAPDQERVLGDHGYAILGQPEGLFACVEDLDPRESDSSDPLMWGSDLRQLSSLLGEAFGVTAATVISGFCYEHWVDGLCVRRIEQRSGEPVHREGAPEPWESDLVMSDSVLVERAYDAALAHFGAHAPGEEPSAMVAEPSRTIERSCNVLCPMHWSS